VEQGCGVDELDHGRQLVVMRTAVVARPGAEQQQRRAEAFAPARDDVLGNLPHENHVGVEPASNHVVDLFDVAGDQRADRIEGYGHVAGRGEALQQA